MKSLKQVAEIILGRSNGLSMSVNDHALKAALGHEGLTEALRRNWLVADEETGHLALSRQAARISEMRQLAGAPESPAINQPEARPMSAGRDLLVHHQGRIEEQACQYQAPVVLEDEDAEVGDEVVVADGGKSFAATVQAKKPDGKLVLSFGATKPANAKEYAKGEFKVTKKTGAKPGQPAQPAKPSGPSVSAGAPSAPGLGPR